MSGSGDKYIANRIRDEVFLPALQEAARRAREVDTTPANLLNGVVGAFSEMLVSLIGPAGTAHLLRGLAEHIEQANQTQQ